ncbi:hypothetical protein CDL15_Pgr016359 [Punica granatum]|uniref:Uncharacterized protein n=1 Tax=Punica granatum TaxID=22663 RepID=A0A218W6M2_PUNGR|nr:hypothetical protein CDL15_Pgr016359 [Punica granatum]
MVENRAWSPGHGLEQHPMASWPSSSRWLAGTCLTSNKYPFILINSLRNCERTSDSPFSTNIGSFSKEKTFRQTSCAKPSPKYPKIQLIHLSSYIFSRIFKSLSPVLTFLRSEIRAIAQTKLKEDLCLWSDFESSFLSRICVGNLLFYAFHS